MRKISKHELIKLLILILSITGITFVTLVALSIARYPIPYDTGGTGDGG